MLRGARELWLSLIAVAVITILYAAILALTKSIPPAGELYGHTLGILGFILMVMTETLFGMSCGLCHSTTAWKPATFDHNLSSFKLTGAHAKLSCQSCHSKGVAGTPSACSACHAEPGYHKGVFGTNCGSCHNTGNWNATYHGPHPAINIHHNGASCRDCHPKTLASATCLKCHDSNNPGDGGGEGGGGGGGGGDGGGD